MPRQWKRRGPSVEWDPKDVVSESELLNRVILSKALVAHSSGKPVLLKTLKEEFEITPRVAEDIMKASGFFNKKRESRPARGSR